MRTCGKIMPLNHMANRNPTENIDMNHYKSWSALNKQLTSFLCDELKNRISYFLTRYHKVRNSYGRAAIRLDGKEREDYQNLPEWVKQFYELRMRKMPAILSRMEECPAR